jgi:threonine dehydrogenase-like Zn-dependent dehydrogenase
MKNRPQPAGCGASRREFLKRSTMVAAGAALAGPLAIGRSAHAAGSDEIKVALIGCGNRGTGAAAQALSTQGPVKLWAMADAFEDRLEASLKNLLAGQVKNYDRQSAEPRVRSASQNSNAD